VRFIVGAAQPFVPDGLNFEVHNSNPKLPTHLSQPHERICFTILKGTQPIQTAAQSGDQFVSPGERAGNRQLEKWL
jgi:hypothetical protein